MSTYNRQATIGRRQSAGDAFSAFSPAGAQQRAEEEKEKLVSSTLGGHPQGNLIFKDVTSDGDDCDSHVDEGEQDEEGKDASEEAHERDKGQRRSRGVSREDVCELVCARCRFKVADEPFKLNDSPVGSTACPRAGRSIGWQLGRMNDIVGSATHRV